MPAFTRCRCREMDCCAAWASISRRKPKTDRLCSAPPSCGTIWNEAMSAGSRDRKIFRRALDMAAGCDELFEGHIVENGGDRVPNIGHRTPHLTGFRIGAVVAGLIGRAAGAADRRQRPVERADDMADADFGGRPREGITAAGSFFRTQNADIAQFQEDRIEEFLRNIVAGGNVVDEGSLARRQPRQIDQRLQAVFSLFRQHCLLPCRKRNIYPANSRQIASKA
ncbi:hypothetical protein RHECNPAF_35000101 [Rhizobium etli CNPAF512]|nr:hypothetical protein RHECNPAF_35000101 [Rhizobium etli CNPAF512]